MSKCWFLCWLHLIQSPGQYVLRNPLMESQESERSAIAENTTNFKWQNTSFDLQVKCYSPRLSLQRRLWFYTYQKPHRFPVSQKSPHISHQQSKGRNERERVHMDATTEIGLKVYSWSTPLIIFFKYSEYTLSILTEPSSLPTTPQYFGKILIYFDQFWCVYNVSATAQLNIPDSIRNMFGIYKIDV